MCLRTKALITFLQRQSSQEPNGFVLFTALDAIIRHIVSIGYG